MAASNPARGGGMMAERAGWRAGMMALGGVLGIVLAAGTRRRRAAQDHRARQAQRRAQWRHADDRARGRQADRHRRRAHGADRRAPRPRGRAPHDGVVGRDPVDQAGQGRHHARRDGLDRSALRDHAADRPDLLLRHLPRAEAGHQLVDLRGHEGPQRRHRLGLHAGARAQGGRGHRRGQALRHDRRRLARPDRRPRRHGDPRSAA